MCFFGRNFTQINIYIPLYGETFRQIFENNVFEFFVHISTQFFVS
jgi:hypothetical protein